MVNKLLAIALLLSLFVPIAQAVSLTLETEPNRDVSIFIQDSTTNYLIESFHKNSGPKGEVFVEFSTSEPDVDALVKIKNDKVELYSKRFESLSTATLIEIELPEREDECDALHLNFCANQIDCQGSNAFWYDEKCNAEECTGNHLDLCKSETACQKANSFWYDSTCHAEAQPIINETAEENSTSLTGLSIFGEEDNFLSNKIFWIAVISLVVLALAAIYVRHKLRSPPSYKKIKIPHNPKALEYELTQAERKLQAAQSEIKRLQNQGKIAEARKKIEADKEYLHKLERGEL